MHYLFHALIAAVALPAYVPWLSPNLSPILGAVTFLFAGFAHFLYVQSERHRLVEAELVSIRRAYSHLAKRVETGHGEADRLSEALAASRPGDQRVSDIVAEVKVLQRLVEKFQAENLAVICGTVHEPDRREIHKTYAVIEDDRDQRIYRLIEKPRNPPNHIRGTGNCIFRSLIFDYIPLTPINQNREEKELPDLIQCAIDDGLAVKSFDIGDGYVNINTPEDIAIAEKRHGEHFAETRRARA